MTPPVLVQLGRIVQREQEELFDSVAPSTWPARYHATAGRPRFMRRGLGLILTVAAALAAAAAVLGLFVAPRLSTAVPAASAGLTAPSLESNWLAVPEGESTTLEFAERVWLVLAGGARARISANTGSNVDLFLETGTVDVLSERGGVPVRIAAGPFTMLVSEGSATFRWDMATEELELAVGEGVVVISGCQYEQGRSVSASKELRTHCMTIPPIPDAR